MIKIPESPHFEKNSKKLKNNEQPCVVCGKPCPNPTAYIHVGNGGDYAVTEEEANANPAGDLGSYPVGPECWRKHPELHSYGWTEKKK